MLSNKLKRLLLKFKIFFPEFVVPSGEQGARLLLVSGAPLREPVAWHGPIVMNTRAELQKAFQELNSGEFVKAGAQWKFVS